MAREPILTDRKSNPWMMKIVFNHLSLSFSLRTYFTLSFFRSLSSEQKPCQYNINERLEMHLCSLILSQSDDMLSNSIRVVSSISVHSPSTREIEHKKNIAFLTVFAFFFFSSLLLLSFLFLFFVHVSDNDNPKVSSSGQIVSFSLFI